MYSLFSTIVSIILSFIVGAIAVGLCAYYSPDTLETIQINASVFKDWLIGAMTDIGSTAGVKIWVRFLLADEQIVFLFFVILARIFLYLLFGLIHRIFIRPFQQPKSVYH